MAEDLTLERAITEAVRTPSDPVYDRILQLLFGRELFLRLGTPDHGRPTLETVPAGPLQCLRLFTSKTHPLLDAPFGGMSWEAAADMSAKLPHITGLMIVNAQDDWVVYGKELVLETVRARHVANGRPGGLPV